MIRVTDGYIHESDVIKTIISVFTIIFVFVTFIFKSKTEDSLQTNWTPLCMSRNSNRSKIKRKEHEKGITG